ncbi:MAG: hypothetical protein BRD55_06995 [Bacteroidetes bacterium SW_9_63_38]|nr:MAG: hypothetical protein BRD55_06995 [Bacteroidetes bacterium SW_9_63_38]
MQRFSSLLLAIFVAFSLALVTGCDATTSDSGSLDVTMSESSTKTMSKRTTASDVDTARVTIEELSIVPAGKASDGESTDVGVTVLTDSNFTVDLKNLQEGIDAVLPTAEIPTGTYGQLRLVTTDKAKVSFTNTTGTEDVMIASGQQTGLKVNFSKFTIESADDRVEMTVNWDVTESLKGSGSGQYVITPAINDATVTVTSATDDDGGSN